ncbi:MAG: hypothetical protein KGJ86_18000, partial [Chloroflexota bacterium]|nr:hypothetical protein [Chloroflexota bacterium]
MRDRPSLPDRAGAGAGYAEVVVDTTVQRGAKTYTYSIPEGLVVSPGQRVRVPFGRQ